MTSRYLLDENGETYLEIENAPGTYLELEGSVLAVGGAVEASGSGAVTSAPSCRADIAAGVVTVRKAALGVSASAIAGGRAVYGSVLAGTAPIEGTAGHSVGASIPGLAASRVGGSVSTASGASAGGRLAVAASGPVRSRLSVRGGLETACTASVEALRTVRSGVEVAGSVATACGAVADGRFAVAVTAAMGSRLAVRNGVEVGGTYSVEGYRGVGRLSIGGAGERRADITAAGGVNVGASSQTAVGRMGRAVASIAGSVMQAVQRTLVGRMLSSGNSATESSRAVSGSVSISERAFPKAGIAGLSATVIEGEANRKSIHGGYGPTLLGGYVVKAEPLRGIGKLQLGATGRRRCNIDIEGRLNAGGISLPSGRIPVYDYDITLAGVSGTVQAENLQSTLFTLLIDGNPAVLHAGTVNTETLRGIVSARSYQSNVIIEQIEET